MKDGTAPPCTWSKEDGWITPEGRPCPETHCAMRGRCPNHVKAEAGEITCPKCIGRTRSDLSHVEQLYATMPAEAVHAGMDSEAANLAGPVAASDQLAARRQYRAADENDQGWCSWPRHSLEDDPHHPAAVLGRWDMMLREDYGPSTDLLTSVSRAADYIRILLRESSFPHSREFEEFARDLAACRHHLEAVVHDSRTPELGRPCPTCSTLEDPGPRLRKRFAKHDRTGASDTWHCSWDPAHWWSERDYRDRVASDYRQHAALLSASELAQRLDVPLSTVRKWASRRWLVEERRWEEPRLVSRRKGPDGRKVYLVATALVLAEDERRHAVSAGA